MNLSEMSEFVRAQADTDVTDAPDSNLEVYARAAYRDIQARVFPWPDKRTTYEFTSAVGQFGYGVAALTGGTNMDLIISVYSNDDVLMYVSPERFLQMRTDSSSNGKPIVYTVTAGQIRLWPTPNAVATYSVEGYRSFNTWPSGSTQPDLPRSFDEPICWYMLARFYQAQEDLELYQQYMRDYDVAVNQQIEDALRGSSMTAGPMIFGGDPRLSIEMSYDDWVKRGVEG